MDCAPDALAEAANCILASLDAGQMDAVETWLACQISNSGGGGGGSVQVYTGAAPPAAPADPTAAALFYPTGGGQLSQWSIGGAAWV